MKTRFIKVVACKKSATGQWDGDCKGFDGRHETEDVFEIVGADELDKPFNEEQFKDLFVKAPKVCKYCGRPAPDDMYFSYGRLQIYDTASGKPELGDMYFVKYHEPDEQCYVRWNNCDGKHLQVVLPNGNTWDIDGRANNCTMPDEKTHRCWVRHGEPPNVHVDKNGYTCAAGAGSILSGDYHGFLHNGELTQC